MQAVDAVMACQDNARGPIKPACSLKIPKRVTVGVIRGFRACVFGGSEIPMANCFATFTRANRAILICEVRAQKTSSLASNMSNAAMPTLGDCGGCFAWSGWLGQKVDGITECRLHAPQNCP